MMSVPLTPPRPPPLRPGPKRRKPSPGPARLPQDQTHNTNDDTASQDRPQPSQRSQLNGEKPPLSLQQNLLTALCFSNGPAGSEAAKRLAASDFVEPYNEIAAKALAYRLKYGKAPGFEHTSDLFADKLRDPKSEQAQIYQRILVALYRHGSEINDAFVIDTLDDFIRTQAHMGAIVAALACIKGGGPPDEVERIFAEAFAKSRARVEPARLESWSAALAVTEPIRPRQWVLGTTALSGALSVLIGPGGVGKSALAIAMAISISVGRGICGDFVFRRRRALIISLEDDADELKRRIAAAMQRHDIARGEVDGWLDVATVGDGAVIAKATPKGELVPGELFERLRAEIVEKQIGMVVIDPLIHAHELDENSSRDMGYLARLLVRLAVETGAAILAVHHTRKGGAQGGDADSARGSSALVNAARTAATVSAMTESDAGKLLVPEEERRSVVRFDSAKANMAPPEKAKWFRLVSVPLGNSDEVYKSGDKVQAVETWTPPDVFRDDDLQEAMSAILDEIDKGLPDGERHSNDSRATDRAAWRVVKRLCPAIDDKVCRAVINRWVKSGALRRERYYSEKRREERTGLFLKEKKPASGASDPETEL